MKTEEDEAFDDLARRQGMWGGGFPAKRAMAADKLQEPAQEQEEDWGALAEKQLASIKRDTRASFEDATVRATHKVMVEFEAQPAQEPLHIVQSNGKHSPLLTHMMNKRTALAQPAQEPFGWYSAQEDEFMTDKIRKEHERLNSYTHINGKFDLALYAAPPKRKWVGLTDEDIERIKLMTYEKETNADGEEQEAVNIDWLIKTAEHFCKEKNND